MNPSEACDFISRKPGAIASLLLFVALGEARRHKWHESQRLGRDAGQQSVIEWFRKNWSAWYRDHWVEHVCGKKFWQEFGVAGFDVPNKPCPNEELLKDIIDHVSQYGENLGIIIWATESNQDMSQVLEILRMMDINGKRAEFDESRISLLSDAMDEADRYKWIISEKAGRDLGDEAVLEWFRLYWSEWYNKVISRESSFYF